MSRCNFFHGPKLLLTLHVSCFSTDAQAKEILFTKALLNKYIADYTGQPVDKVEADCDRDFFMTPQEALDYGIIDEVIQTKTSHIPMPGMPSLFK